MKKTITVICADCGENVEKPRKEYNRSTRLRRRFFCNAKCAGSGVNESKKAEIIDRKCLYCGKIFSSRLTAKGSKVVFCSRECASAGSVTDCRRRGNALGGRLSVGNLLPAWMTLKKREAHKYVLLEPELSSVSHEFEYALGNFVFDLALPEHRILVEFDGEYHHDPAQAKVDHGKDIFAAEQGFSVIRIPTKDTVIPASVLSILFESASYIKSAVSLADAGGSTRPSPPFPQSAEACAVRG